MIDESHWLDAPLALTVICCMVAGLAILCRRPPHRPISRQARRRILEHIDQQETQR